MPGPEHQPNFVKEEMSLVNKAGRFLLKVLGVTVVLGISGLAIKEIVVPGIDKLAQTAVEKF
jgi:hypothetical protein